MKKNIHKNEYGFTLIELILYIALVSIFLTGAVLFTWDIVYGRVRSSIQQEANQNLRHVAKRISYEVRNASDINSLASGDLCLASSELSHNPTRIYLDSGLIKISWGGGSIDCSSMINDEALTSSDFEVTDLTFSNQSSGSDSYNIGFSFTIENTTDRVEWQTNQTYTGSSEMRSN